MVGSYSRSKTAAKVSAVGKLKNIKANKPGGCAWPNQISGAK
jgi:hypothetical protein